MTEPVSIDVDRTTAVTIVWDDGHASRYPVAGLRRDCPCAGCRADRQAGRSPAMSDGLAIVDVKMAGAWGLTPTWNDGHNTGIYSWGYLRAACPCPACHGGVIPSGT